ncbi:hypothetical protein DevBK_17800 [Devosia sp. BK]|uniref:hypothetical protein n=1 Tax=Devosia sp. BK TaxID=2871706 RepID=UPI002939F313|nr:hypothetical protein [Devosia sp. BK]MDV3253196.1 hypothetical protein [Devosia sp. BK]
MTRAWGLWLSLIVAVALFAGSATAAYREIVPYFAGGDNAQEKLDFLATGAPDPGLSLQAQRLILDDCVATLLPLVGTALNEETEKVRVSCQSLAEGLLRDAPLFSYAWFGLAVTQAFDGASADFQHSLAQSQLTTANQWAMASLRLALAYPFWSTLPPELQSQLGADIVVLAHSGPGREWLAQRYAGNPDFREDITANLEKAPPNLQRAFVRAVSSQGTGS